MQAIDPEARRYLRGHMIQTRADRTWDIQQDVVAVLSSGRLQAILRNPSSVPADAMVEDWRSGFFIPGFCDLHLHASQWEQRGIGMDRTLLDWLTRYTYPTEEQFASLEHAKRVYKSFGQALLRCGTLYASIFATVHSESTDLLADILADLGVYAFVGKVNMDQNSSTALQETGSDSLAATERFIQRWRHHDRIRPIITPRFIPSCSSQLLSGLGRLAADYEVPVQSHLAETEAEAAWVKQLQPEAPTYAHAYYQHGLFGQTPTWMAHCIYLTPAEQELQRKQQVTAVHCPESNLNLGSGLMPARALLDCGINVALGSDIGAGHDLFIPRSMVCALQASNLRSTLLDNSQPLSLADVFHMGTKAGAAHFGRQSGFSPGHPFDALWIDDQALGPQDIPLEQRLQRFIYTGQPKQIAAVFLASRSAGEGVCL